MSTIFISYRREETAGEARALLNELVKRLGEPSIFMDVDNIALGRDFRRVLEERLASCDLMLVLIGRNWLDARDEAGALRLADTNDFVRLEVATALRRDIRVTPILVQGARIPSSERLPDDLKDLAYRNGFELGHSRWESDVREMIRRLELDLAKGSLANDFAAPISSGDRLARTSIGRRWWVLPLLWLTLAISSGILYYLTYYVPDDLRDKIINAAESYFDSSRPAGIVVPSASEIAVDVTTAKILEDLTSSDQNTRFTAGDHLARCCATDPGAIAAMLAHLRDQPNSLNENGLVNYLRLLRVTFRTETWNSELIGLAQSTIASLHNTNRTGRLQLGPVAMSELDQLEQHIAGMAEMK